MDSTLWFAALVFALTITLPNLLIMALGLAMRRWGQINANFVDIASALVFRYCMPCLLFFSVSGSSVDIRSQLPLIGAGVLVTLLLFIGAELYARWRITDPADQGVFVQGVYRSNMAIMSLATVANAYGKVGLSVGAVYMGVVTILFNVLAVITLSRTQQHTSMGARIINMGKTMLKNPLIIALVAAFVYKGLHLPPLPTVIHHTGDLLAAMALPLALICAGASLDFASMLRLSGVSMQASLGRVIVAPLVAVAVGLAFGLPPLSMGVLFLMVASPVAAASYVMAKAMGANDVAAANILAFTTVVSMLSMAVGAGMLRAFGLM